MCRRLALVLSLCAAIAACAESATDPTPDSSDAGGEQDAVGGADNGVTDAGGGEDPAIADLVGSDATPDAGTDASLDAATDASADTPGLDLGADTAPDITGDTNPDTGCSGGPCGGPRPLASVIADGNVLREPDTGWSGLGFGISAFYCPSVSREEYTAFIDAIAGVGMDYARFSGSTLSWGNREGRPEVIPFLPGVHPYEPDDPDVGGYTNDPDPAFFDELDWRLDYATEHGIRVQYTILWGATRPMFVRLGDNPGLRRDDTRDYIHYVAERLAAHPEHLVEIINEADHGHHLARLGREGRREAIGDMAGWVRDVHPNAVISVSDGGRQPDAEGEPYFDYHEVDGLSYWNVHFPRDEVYAQGIPRWARGVWHLYTDRNSFAANHPGLGYGRNDENIFLQTQAEHDAWAYGGSTRDWRMYANMMWVSTIAGVGFTLHSQKGFFCYPDVANDPIFGPIRAHLDITDGFPFAGARSYNTSWAGSPIREFDDSFKAFALVSSDQRDMLMYVLNPAGTLRLDLAHEDLTGTFYDPLTGTVLGTFEPPAGASVLSLPAPLYEHGLVIRIRAGAVERPTIEAAPAAAITVDGDLADWPDGVSFTPLRAPGDYIARDQAASGDSDVSADIAVAWTEDALFVAVEVLDETHVNERADDLIWDGDGVQVAFDTGLNGGGGYDATDDFELGYALTSDGVAEHRWFTPGGAPASTAETAVTRGAGRTVYEVRIPRADLLLDPLATGLELGFSLIVNDADQPGISEIGAARDGWLEWTPGIGLSKNPGAFGRLVLVP